MSLQHQDWNVVVFKKNKPETEIKQKTQINPQASLYRKLEADIKSKPTEEQPDKVPLPKLSHQSCMDFIKARTDKKLKRSDLAKQLNVLEKVIADLETGKVITDRSILVKVNKVLGTKLKFT